MTRLLLSSFVCTVVFASCILHADEIVTEIADSGVGSLRQAIADSFNGDTITFDAELDGATIALESGELAVTKSITIDASALPNGITITRSTAPGAQISRIFLLAFSDIVLDSLTIENGKAPDATGSEGAMSGGGIFAGSPGGAITLRRCTIRNCDAGDGHPSNNIGGGGGGIYNSGNLVIEECVIHNNSAGDGFSNGVGANGGGIAHISGNLTIVNSTITGNRAGDGDTEGVGMGGFGGGVYLAGSVSKSDETTIVSSTIAENAAGRGDTNSGKGGGLLANALAESVTLENTIIAGNRIGQAPAANEATSDIELHNSLVVTTDGVNAIGIRDGAASFFPAPGNPGDPNNNGDFVGDVGDPIDVMLGPLSDNGGPTLSMTPDPTSIVVDPIGGDTIEGVPTDQRGFPRRSNGLVDVGAVEFGAEDEEARRLAAALAARRKVLQRKVKKLNRQLRSAKRSKKKSRIKRFKKKLRKVRRQLRRL